MVNKKGARSINLAPFYDIGGNWWMIAYYKLLDMLNKRDMTKEQLRIKAGLASGTMTKISKGEPVNLKTIDLICKALQVQPGDILEYIEK